MFSLPVQTTILLPDHSVREVSLALSGLVGAGRRRAGAAVVGTAPGRCRVEEAEQLVLDTEDQTFRCGFCDETFPHLDLLVRHKKVHTSKISGDDFPDFDTAVDCDEEVETEETCDGDGGEVAKSEVQPEPAKTVIDFETTDFQSWEKPKPVKQVLGLIYHII